MLHAVWYERIELHFDLIDKDFIIMATSCAKYCLCDKVQSDTLLTSSIFLNFLNPFSINWKKNYLNSPFAYTEESHPQRKFLFSNITKK